ncbi:hypothetical protein GA0070606_2569 [Micromonospora citrea]|uniref:Uncharacterized protein n=1 Tax=Micromonospora citrea TaxID=47855 RepID=A0A1C6UQN9_9ACTN|nr:hypothetical protein [Micromonospora citrea]SCL56223.1 hypothetical protein GA0070606_2569 [Micromonospora citrea]
MARVDVRPGRRARDRRTVPLLAISLAAGLTVASVPGWATAAPTAARVATAPTEPVGEPGEEPTADPTDPVPSEAPSTVSPPPQSTPPAATTEPAPTTTAPQEPAPTTTSPTTSTPPPAPSAPPVRPSAPAPGSPSAPAAGVSVTTDDITLTSAYWNAPSTVTTLRVTVTNTGASSARVRLAYTLPAGLTDAGTEGCADAGGGEHRCGEWTSAPGARFSTLLRVRVGGDAWRKMPLSGSVRVTAAVPGAAPVSDNEGFAVLFPPGPPAPGIRLAADEVTFDISGGASGLDVRLGNTGRVDADGRVEVILPAGVTVPAPPAGCTTVDPTRTRCDLGTVPAGRTADLRLPVAATPEAQRQAPLAGAVLGQLDPRSGRPRQVQMSFRITAAAALATPVVSTPAPTGSQGVLAADAPSLRDGGGISSVRRTAITLIAVSTLLVVLALALATTSLRRRSGAAMTERTPGPTPAD